MPDDGWSCRSCGERHEGLPFGYSVPAPVHWSPELDGEDASELGEEVCVIRDEHFFLRARIVLPVLDAVDDFEWGVWVSLSRENFMRTAELWATEGRELDPPAFGWLSVELPYPESTVNLKTRVHTQPVGVRPLVELEPTGHRLAVEQRSGITVARVRQLAEIVLHGD